MQMLQTEEQPRNQEEEFDLNERPILFIKQMNII
jgi:hypothetical protein